MPSGPIGASWATDSWLDTAWEENSWAAAGTGTGAGAQSPRQSRNRYLYLVGEDFCWVLFAVGMWMRTLE